MGGAGCEARRRRDPADQHGPRRNARRLRSRLAPWDHGRRADPRHRVGRRRDPPASGGRHPPRPRERRARCDDLPRRHAHDPRREALSRAGGRACPAARGRRMSSLETSVTLEDVFAVVEAKRVPLAPELAGYLTLEIADGTDAGSGNVDPKTVFISEEGTVALVRPKRDSITGDAEASIRALLTKLL